MTKFLSKDYLISAILKLKREYNFTEDYTTNMELYYVVGRLNDKIYELDLDDTFVVTEGMSDDFMVKNGLIFVGNNGGIDSIFDRYYAYVSNYAKEILYDSKLILSFLVEYKEQELKKENDKLEKLKASLKENKILIKKEG